MMLIIFFYKDGIYTCTGYGYMSDINVPVSINNDKITNVKVVSSNDNYQEPVNVIPQEIVHAQSSNVVAVSGATHTSNGIMSAAADALSKAKTYLKRNLFFHVISVDELLHCIHFDYDKLIKKCYNKYIIE